MDLCEKLLYFLIVEEPLEVTWFTTLTHLSSPRDLPVITRLLKDRSTVLTLDTELLFKHLKLKILHDGNKTKHPKVSPL